MLNRTCERGAPRYPTDADVTCQPYASHGRIQKIDGVMRNFSSGGAYIEANFPFQAGTILIVRMIRYPSVSTSAENEEELIPRSICLAEVRWNQEQKNAHPQRYGMGLKYID